MRLIVAVSVLGENMVSSITGVVSVRILGFQEIAPPRGRGDFLETPKSALRTTPVILLRVTLS